MKDPLTAVANGGGGDPSVNNAQAMAVTQLFMQQYAAAAAAAGYVTYITNMGLSNEQRTTFSGMILNLVKRHNFSRCRIVNNNPKKRKLCESPPSTNANCGYVANFGSGPPGYQQQQQQQHAQHQAQLGDSASPNTPSTGSMTPLNSCLNVPINSIKQEPG